MHQTQSNFQCKLTGIYSYHLLWKTELHLNVTHCIQSLPNDVVHTSVIKKDYALLKHICEFFVNCICETEQIKLMN